jgi:hypothetical protein
MSDAITGGGGGGSDPFGQLQQILDPLGLFKGIGGGIDQILKGGGAEQVKQYQGVALNNVGQFGGVGAGSGSGADPTQTTYEPDAVPTGYGQALDDAANAAGKQAAQGRQRQQSDSAMTATHTEHADQTSERATASSAATATQTSQSDKGARAQSESRMIGNPYEADVDTSKDPEAARAEKLRHLKTVAAYFQWFDEQGMSPHDGKFDRGNLANLIGQANCPPEAKAAAFYLLSHPEVTTELAAASGGGSGLIVNGKVAEYIMRLEGTFTAPTNPKGQGGAGGVDKHDTGGGGKPNVGQGNKTDPTPRSETDEPTNTPPPYPNPKSLDETLANVGQSMDDKEADLMKAYKTGNEGQIAKAQLAFTKAQQQFQRLFDLIGNLQRTYHEMSMHSIGHIR